jgi:hypothetical protein
VTATASRVTGKTRGVFASASARQYSTGSSLLLIAPLLVLLAFGFVYPVGRLISASFFNPNFSLAQYARIIEEPFYLMVLWRTMEVAFFVTILALLLGYPVAYAVTRLKGRWAVIVLACVLIPLWTSVLVRSYAWIVLLQRNGVINNALTGAGLIEEPLRLLYTPGAVTVAMTHVLLPFMILPIYSAQHSGRVVQCCTQSRRRFRSRVPQDRLPAEPARRLCGLVDDIHPRARLLHHASPCRRRTHAHDGDADRSADDRITRLALCRRAFFRSSRLDDSAGDCLSPAAIAEQGVRAWLTRASAFNRYCTPRGSRGRWRRRPSFLALSDWCCSFRSCR